LSRNASPKKAKKKNLKIQSIVFSNAQETQMIPSGAPTVPQKQPQKIPGTLDRNCTPGLTILSLLLIMLRSGRPDCGGDTC
jgi:hypothetical protein